MSLEGSATERSSDIMDEEVPEMFGEYQAITPDSLITNTYTLQSDNRTVLKGDYEMQYFITPPEVTLAIIKPDGMRYSSAIERKMREKGYSIVQKRKIQLSLEQASNFYYHHYGEPNFPLMVSTLCTGPIQIYLLRKKDAVDLWRTVCGPEDVIEAIRDWPESLRALYGTPGKDFVNAVHASETLERALEEIRFFFPKVILDQNIKDVRKVEDYLNEFVNPILQDGLIEVCKYKPIEPVIWLANWLLMNNPNKPRLSENLTLTPT